MYQALQEKSLPEHSLLKHFLSPLTGGLDIVSLNGATWKKWRTIFNPGFSAAHLQTLIPSIVQATEAFCELLAAHAQVGNVFALKELTNNLTLEVIGSAILGTNFECQRAFNPMVYSPRKQISWFSTGIEPNLLQRYYPLRPIVQWYHGRIVDAYVSHELERRLVTSPVSPKESKTDDARTIIDLALSAYKREQLEDRHPQSALAVGTSIDPHFKEMCMAQVKVFLFSGHDTMASALCYHLYILSKHPTVLKTMRTEHEAVFSVDLMQAASLISSSPHLLNQLPYTTATIMESLRLYPPVPVSRAGLPGYAVPDASTGKRYPTEGFLVFPNAHSVHRYPAYWPRVTEFLPERRLVPPGDPLYPTKGAWRAFEHGARNCIGQELAMLEMKIVLVLCARRFAIRAAYEELAARGELEARDLRGERTYQVEPMMQPRADLPCRVQMVGESQ